MFARPACRALEVSMRRWSAHFVLALACAGALWSRPLLADDLAAAPRCDDIQLPFGFYANSPCLGDSAYFTFHSCNQCVDLWSTWWDETTRTLTLNGILW